ncbi:MAG: gliding motility-associated C-terminal domain-containing protein [Saprospiraceae bacterium]|nr:gliding motility-associated C-terminal domain-containing protein [Saprospiraceae bacterium]
MAARTVRRFFAVDKSGGVYVPNAFSPNGDGTNDVFMIFSDTKSVLKVNSFLVFNRWGESVYQYFNFYEFTFTLCQEHFQNEKEETYYRFLPIDFIDAFCFFVKCVFLC